ncbi:PilW family protein [Endozoicomonadaceae bacterium StTr2]
MISRRLNQRGLSLIELMISMAMGMFLIAGFGQLFLNSTIVYRSQDELARMQESARFAFDLLSREIRMAGYTGCPQAARLADVVQGTSATNRWGEGFIKRIEGFDQDVDSMSSLFGSTARAGSDSLVIHRGDPDASFFIASHSPVTGTLTTSQGHSINAGSLIVLARADCRQVASAVMTGPSNSGGGATTVQHASGGSGDLRNCSSSLGGDADCSNSTVLAPLSFAGGQVMEAATAAYFVGSSLSGGSNRSLRRRLAGGNSEELIDGIQSMRIYYGVDTDTVPDNVPDRYVKAADVADPEWQNVVAVRIHLLVRSLNESAPAPQTYQFADQRITATDRFIRQEYSMTVALRSVDNESGP